MKFVRFGYYDEKKWATMSESEQNTLMDEFAYDDVLRKNGHTMGDVFLALVPSAESKPARAWLGSGYASVSATPSPGRVKAKGSVRQWDPYPPPDLDPPGVASLQGP